MSADNYYGPVMQPGFGDFVQENEKESLEDWKDKQRLTLTRWDTIPVRARRDIVTILKQIGYW